VGQAFKPAIREVTCWKPVTPAFLYLLQSCTAKACSGTALIQASSLWPLSKTNTNM